MKSEQTLFVEAARQTVRKAGWDPRYDLEVLDPRGPSAQPVRYGWHTGRVRLAYVPGLQQSIVAALESLGGRDGSLTPESVFRDVIAARVLLQVGSFKVCPYSAYDYAEILEASADGLRSAHACEADAYRFMVPATSLFITAVVCGTYALEGPDPVGMRTGWAMDQVASSLAENSSLPAFAAVCANVQLRLWSNAAVIDEALRTRYEACDALDFETDRGVAILLDTFEHAGVADGLAWSDEFLRESIIDELKYNWRAWPLKAFQWAEMLAPYLCATEGHQLPPQPRSVPPNQAGRPSDEARRRRATVHPPGNVDVRRMTPADNSYRPVPGVPMDPFTERMRTDSEFRQRVLQSGIGRGKNPLDYHLNMGFDALDALYRSRAVTVRVEADSVSRKGMALEIAHLARHEVGGGMPDVSRIDWGATRFWPQGGMQLFHKVFPIAEDSLVKAEMRGFPDLLLVVDSSGSMEWDPKGGQGPYDSLLRAIYGVLGFLESRNMIRYVRFAVANFSARTVVTPWHGYADLRKVKEALFRWQGGGTVLDCSAIERVAASSSDRFLCLMVTDSRISNADTALASIRRIAERGHQFIFIQLGGVTPMSTGLSELGIPVHVIADVRELEGLCLEYAQRHYGS